MLWTIFTPLVYYIVNKLKLIKRDIKRNLIIIIFSGIAISLVHRFISVFITFSIRHIDGQLERSILKSIEAARFGILGGSFDSFFVYGLIVSVIVSIIYYNRHRQSELAKSQLETKLAEAKIELLKSQLQPHFLFNTLNAVSTLMHKDVNLAEKVLTKLSDLLRISLEGIGKNKINLKDELDFLRKYLEIQKIRFENKINIIFDIDNSLLDTIVPAFILQPIVENSIKYCVEPSIEAQTIIISARNGDQMLARA